ncbi:MAG: TA system VapC family ribonuclease toxin [Spirochaetota bacterium]
MGWYQTHGRRERGLPLIFWDVNLWVYAFRRDSPYHDRARDVLMRGLDGNEVFLFSPSIAASFFRIVTNPNIFNKPSPHNEAWEFIDTLESHPNARFVEVDQMTYGVFKHLSLVKAVQGNQVPDALLAALSIRYDCLFLTADQCFSEYPGLNLELV